MTYFWHLFKTQKLEDSLLPAFQILGKHPVNTTGL